MLLLLLLLLPLFSKRTRSPDPVSRDDSATEAVDGVAWFLRQNKD